MIKFFRKIRQNLLSEGKTGKYIKYAIGEIILVVIGILIALYLNNQQEEYKIQKQQQNYLKQIKVETLSNLNLLAIEKDELALKVENGYKLINIMKSDSQVYSLSEYEISQMLYEFQRRDNVFFYENGALNQIIFSGGLKDINNDSIRVLLASLEGKLSEVRLQENQVIKAQENLADFFYQNGDFRSLADDMGFSKIVGLDNSANKKGNKNLLLSKKYENYVFQFVAYGTSLKNNEYLNFENELKSLIGLINEELNEK
ncbi:MAG: hypothetical protein CO068_08320 [Flavobacteriaceae bacterium CG_4_9_14_0_8_um_filter_34_30]|nr:MAG: hypothetical protein CO068_08320 [Flavobacteriaceae bacterium CG_4_9_14_0_8_um_filter_34_30]